MKPKIITFESNNNLTLPIVEDIVSSHFDYVPVDQNTTYDKLGTLFVCNWYQYERNKSFIDRLMQEGYWVLFENLQEAQLLNNGAHNLNNNPNVLFAYAAKRGNTAQNIIEVPLYFWFCESLSWSGRTVDYRNVRRTLDTATKRFFMPMNFQRDFRDLIYDKFTDLYEDSIYSYVDRGKHLNNDVDRYAMFWDRHLDIEWYNQTHFSVVVETMMDYGDGSVFITEKSMKPLAFKHPFVSLSCENTLDLLKSAGFETFDNLFDESYNTVSTTAGRIDRVYEQVKNFTKAPYDSLTLEKLEHNHRLFFDNEQVARRYTSDVLVPLLEKINA